MGLGVSGVALLLGGLGVYSVTGANASVTPADNGKVQIKITNKTVGITIFGCAIGYGQRDPNQWDVDQSYPDCKNKIFLNQTGYTTVDKKDLSVWVSPDPFGTNQYYDQPSPPSQMCFEVYGGTATLSLARLDCDTGQRI